MAKKGGLRFTNEAELRAAFPHAEILSDTGSSTKVKQAIEQVEVETLDEYDRLTALIGKNAKISKHSSIYPKAKCKILEVVKKYTNGASMVRVSTKFGNAWVFGREIEFAKGVGRHHANPQWYDGFYFKSEGEKNRYIFLAEAQRLGLIRDLKLQPTYVLQPKFEREILVVEKVGTKKQVKHGAMKFSADFGYTVVATEIDWVEDYKTASKKTGKAFMTASSTRAIKQFLFMHPGINFLINTEREFIP